MRVIIYTRHEPFPWVTNVSLNNSFVFVFNRTLTSSESESEENIFLLGHPFVISCILPITSTKKEKKASAVKEDYCPRNIELLLKHALFP